MSHDAVAKAQATNFYFDRGFNCQAVKILPGEFHVTDRDMLLVTTLGSCVAACIRDVKSGIGGINHFMLPEGGSADSAAPVSLSARYGTFAMEVLINELIKLGARRTHLEAKVFGGGNVLKGMTITNVGERNAQFVKQFLALESIPIAAMDLMEDYPRKVYFFPRTGRVLVKKLRSLSNDTIASRESDYARRLVRAPVAGDVELFS